MIIEPNNGAGALRLVTSGPAANDLPAAVSLADYKADMAQLERDVIANALVSITRDSIGHETRMLAAQLAAQVCRPDGSQAHKATHYEVEYRLAGEETMRRLFAAVFEGKGAEARDILLRIVEDMALEQHEIEAARVEEDEQGRIVYELR